MSTMTLYIVETQALPPHAGAKWGFSSPPTSLCRRSLLLTALPSRRPTLPIPSSPPIRKHLFFSLRRTLPPETCWDAARSRSSMPSGRRATRVRLASESILSPPLPKQNQDRFFLLCPRGLVTKPLLCVSTLFWRAQERLAFCVFF